VIAMTLRCQEKPASGRASKTAERRLCIRRAWTSRLALASRPTGAQSVERFTLWVRMGTARCLFHKFMASSRVFPGSATLQRGFWTLAGARRSQGEGTGAGLTKWTSSFDTGGKKGGESRFSKSKTEVLAPCEILLQSTLPDFV